MSMHERSMLAHDLHSLASTMDTIKDENEEEVSVNPKESLRDQDARVLSLRMAYGLDWELMTFFTMDTIKDGNEEEVGQFETF